MLYLEDYIQDWTGTDKDYTGLHFEQEDICSFSTGSYYTGKKKKKKYWYFSFILQGFITAFDNTLTH